MNKRIELFLLQHSKQKIQRVLGIYIEALANTFEHVYFISILN